MRDRGQERIPNQPGADTRTHGEQQSYRDPTHGVDAPARFEPARAAGHVLNDDGDGQREAADETAAGQIMTAQEQVNRQRAGRREHQSHYHGRHEYVFRDRIASFVLGFGVVDGLLLLWAFHAFGCRAEAAQQGETSQSDDPEHGDFAEGVEAADVHQYHVDDVSPAALAIGALQAGAGDGLAKGEEADGLRQAYAAAAV